MFDGNCANQKVYKARAVIIISQVSGNDPEISLNIVGYGT